VWIGEGLGQQIVAVLVITVIAGPVSVGKAWRARLQDRRPISEQACFDQIAGQAFPFWRGRDVTAVKLRPGATKVRAASANWRGRNVRTGMSEQRNPAFQRQVSPGIGRRCSA